ncbi:MAG: hypothetical protein WDZ69_01480 [Candidatus Pacearchaeota archaeon]
MEIKYFESPFSREERIIIRDNLLEKSYKELVMAVESYDKNQGILRRTLGYIGMIKEPEKVRAYRKTINICEEVERIVNLEGIVGRV